MCINAYLPLSLNKRNKDGYSWWSDEENVPLHPQIIIVIG